MQPMKPPAAEADNTMNMACVAPLARAMIGAPESRNAHLSAHRPLPALPGAARNPKLAPLPPQALGIDFMESL